MKVSKDVMDLTGIEPSSSEADSSLAAGPSPQISAGGAARFLEQASFGPTAASGARVLEIGYSRWIDEQFETPSSAIADVPPAANGRAPLAPVQQEFYYNAVNGADQLRQRVALALSEIWVVSGVKLTTADRLTPYLRLLQAVAFTTYREIAYQVTLSPSMGQYLDMVNNLKPDPRTGRSADENYERELLQLFTIGLLELNLDGTIKLDGEGNPVSTYTQDQVTAFARAFTGWTYAPKAGAPSRAINHANWDAAMVATESNHDRQPKSLLRALVLPAGQTARIDLEGALDNILSHPNLAPFVSRQLIQRLVASNPSPGYVERVSRIFQATGGDMKLIVKAILLDMEARAGDEQGAPGREGKLREPALYIVSVLRALEAKVGNVNSLPAQAARLGQNIYLSPSVFNYFTPGYEISSTGLNAPEFEILTGSTAMLRADFMNTLAYRSIPGVTIDWDPWLKAAESNWQLMLKVNSTLMRGAMPAEMLASITRAVAAQPSARARVQAAIYLTASSWQYQIQR